MLNIRIEILDIQYKISEAGLLFLPNGKIVVYLQIVLGRDYTSIVMRLYCWFMIVYRSVY